MEFSTEVVQKMAGIMVHEMEQLGVADMRYSRAGDGPARAAAGGGCGSLGANVRAH